MSTTIDDTDLSPTNSATLEQAEPEPIRHPGLGFLDHGLCDGHEPFFVDAGHVIKDEVQQMCKKRCPVRRECLIHAYLGGPNGPILGGYMAGFSVGQRKSMTLSEALAKVDEDNLASGR